MNAIPTLQRLSDYVEWHARQTPDATAAVLDGERLSYADLAHRVRVTANALMASGIQPGDRVATLAPPGIDFLVTFLATISVGAIWLGLNPRYQLGELLYVLRDAEPRLLFARETIGGRSFRCELEEIRRQCEGLENLVILDTNDETSESFRLDTFLQRADGYDRGPPQPSVELEPCMIVYTSGSTGRPKGAVLHHRGLIHFSLLQNEAWPVSSRSFLNYFPINHVGCVVDITATTLVDGGKIVFLEQFDVIQSLSLMQSERISIWASVPSVFQMQLAHPDLAAFDLSAVELVVWEGAAMPRELIDRLLLHCRNLATNFSMTETTGAVTLLRPSDDAELLANSVGFPANGVEIRIVGADGQEVTRGEVGELQSRSVMNMVGYWRRPEETAETLSVSGWLRTGDLVTERLDGSLRVVGRLKEMFKSGGYNVYPREIEAILEGHPDIMSAAVVGIPDPLWQEVGSAFVVVGRPFKAGELKQYCQGYLAAYKVPKYFYVVEELPLLPIGKIDKLALRKIATEAVGKCQLGIY